jgi:transcriptional regulator with XRE-family HTH domain
MKDQGVRERFVELRAKGWSFDRIAKELKVSKQTLINWSRELTLDIRNRRAIEQEALLEQFSLTCEAKIQFIGDLMGKLRDELMSRNLTSVSSERLFEMALKTLAEWERISPELTLGVKEDPLVSLNNCLEKTIANWSV